MICVEQWNPVVGYEKLYAVSNHGRVKSFSRKIKQISRCGKYFYRVFPGKILSPVRHEKDGYLHVDLCRHGTIKRKGIHVLVARAFIKNEECKPQPNHKDGKKDNNYYENLEWVTLSENNFHSKNVLHPHLLRPIVGIKGNKKIFFKSISQAKRSGFSTGAISDCLNHPESHHTHKGYIWSDLTSGPQPEDVR
jgi:NUMOD4 motif